MEKPTPTDKLLFDIRGEILILDAKVETVFQMLVALLAKQTALDVNHVHQEWLMIQKDLVDANLAQMRETVQTKNR